MAVKESLLRSFLVKEIPPPSTLEPYISKYYVYENLKESLPGYFFRALPNGMVELFFFVGGNRIVFREKQHEQRLSGFLAGVFKLDYPMKIKVENNVSQLKGLSVLFTHLGVNLLLGHKLYELTNRIIGIDRFRYQDVYRQYMNISEIEDERLLFENLNEFFLHQLRSKNYQTQRIVPLLNNLEHMKGLLTIDRITSEFGFSYKRLYRLFTDEMGMSPKMYLKILRFNRACYLFDRASEKDIAEIVYKCGYYDQAHFQREFKSIMNESPHSMRGKFYFNRPYALK
mgnify:FL=1